MSQQHNNKSAAVTLYKHKNNKDVAVEILRFIKIPGKDYARIKVRWWNIGPHEPFSMMIDQWLTDATIKGNKKERMKYPLTKWEQNWRLYEG